MVEARHDVGGVSVDTLLEGVETSAEYVLAFCDGGYTTNVPLEDLTGGKAWVASTTASRSTRSTAGARLLVPHLYFWKSAKWVRGLRLMSNDEPASGSRTATTCTAIRGWSSGTGATDVAGRDRRRGRPETPRTKTLARSARVGRHRAGQHVDIRLTAEDGYQAQRSYSIASASEQGSLGLTVERIDDGEVSPYLTDEARPATCSRCAARSAATSSGTRIRR